MFSNQCPNFTDSAPTAPRQVIIMRETSLVETQCIDIQDWSIHTYGPSFRRANCGFCWSSPPLFNLPSDVITDLQSRRRSRLLPCPNLHYCCLGTCAEVLNGKAPSNLAVGGYLLRPAPHPLRMPDDWTHSARIARSAVLDVASGRRLFNARKNLCLSPFPVIDVVSMCPMPPSHFLSMIVPCNCIQQ